MSDLVPRLQDNAQDLADLIRQLSEQMHTAAEQLQFELAARLRDEIKRAAKTARKRTSDRALPRFTDSTAEGERRFTALFP